MNTARNENRYHKYGWPLVFLAALFLLLAGSIIISEGVPGAIVPDWVPSSHVSEIQDLQNERGLMTVLAGVLLAAVSWGGFRNGEKWAWYTAGVVALIFLAVGLGALAFASTTALAFLSWVVLILLAIAMLLSFRQAFPQMKP